MHAMRTTTGQAVTISYDAASNTLVIREEDWFVDPVRSSAAPPKSLYRQRLVADVAAKPPMQRQRRSMRPAPQPPRRARQASNVVHLAGQA